MTLEDAISMLTKLNFTVTFLREEDIEDNNESILVESPDEHSKYLPSYEALIHFAKEVQI